MVHGRRSFGSIEQRSGYFRARYVGPDQGRYEAPHGFVSKIDAEYWLAEIHREIVREEWRPPQKDVEADPEVGSVAGYAVRRTYSGKFVVRVPPGLHRQLVIEAADQHVSLNA